MTDPDAAEHIARAYLDRHREEASPEFSGEVLRYLARHGGRLADLVGMAEAGDRAAIEAARQLAADMLDDGELPPEPLRRFAVAALKPKRGRQRQTLRKLLMLKAVWRVVQAGHGDRTAAEAVANAGRAAGLFCVDGESLLKWYRQVT